MNSGVIFPLYSHCVEKKTCLGSDQRCSEVYSPLRSVVLQFNYSGSPQNTLRMDEKLKAASYENMEDAGFGF